MSPKLLKFWRNKPSHAPIKLEQRGTFVIENRRLSQRVRANGPSPSDILYYLGWRVEDVVVVQLSASGADSPLILPYVSSQADHEALPDPTQEGG